MSAPEASARQTASSKPVTAARRGRWNGPAGTRLGIAGDDGRDRLTVRGLDSLRAFAGRAMGDHIEVERDGRRESIRLADGHGTGMKWLAGKRPRLAIRPGEGYGRG